MTRPSYSSRVDAEDRPDTRENKDGGRTQRKTRTGSSSVTAARILIAAPFVAAIALVVVLSALGVVPLAEYLRPTENIRHAVSRVLLVGGLIGLLLSLLAKWTD